MLKAREGFVSVLKVAIGEERVSWCAKDEGGVCMCAEGVK